MGLDLRLLGPVAAFDEGRQLPLGPRKQRLVLAVLGLTAGRPVGVTELVDLAWPDDPPRTAAHAIRVCVSGLRSALREIPDTRITLEGSGYTLRTDPAGIDVHRFSALLTQARGAVDDARRVALLDQALGLWNGPPLAGVAAPDVQQRLAAGLAEQRLAAIEDRFDAQLRLGRQHELLAELTGLVAGHPLRERLVGQLMIALYREGRTADALTSFRRHREQLAEELGLDAGPRLRQLELAILRDDTAALTAAAGQSGGHVSLIDAVPEAAGQVTTAAPVPAQLPPAVGGFTGRAAALAELGALLPERPLAGSIAVIAGMAGVGKTALAVHWAHRHRGAFPDGQLYVNLGGYAPGPPMPPERALAGFLRALGVPAERIPVDADEAAALYRSLLADRRVLVVLDNASTPGQVRPLLPGGAGCLTVITSRDRLAGLTARDGAYHLDLGVLTEDEALALLAELLGATRTQADLASAAELAALCARLPLALRIATSHLARHPAQPVAELNAELREGNRLAVLEVDGDEQSAVRAAFELSHTTLGPDARRMFQLAGVQPGSDLSADAAAALAGTATAAARRPLADLASAHLLDEHMPGRFAMHDLLRLYAAERAEQEISAADRAAATSRLCEYYLRAADAAARVLYPNMQRLPLPSAMSGAEAAGAAIASHADAQAWLEAERPNLVATVTRAAQHGPRQAAWLIADAMRGYFWTRRHHLDWLAVAEAGLAAAAAEQDWQAMAAADLSLAAAKRSLTRFQEAAGHLIEAAALARRAGWRQGEAAAVGSLANVYRDQGRMSEAADQHRRALEIYRQTGSRGGEATSLVNLGNVLLEMGCAPDDVVTPLVQSLRIYREIGARHAEANALNSLGCAYLIQSRYTEALDHLDQALALHREIGSREGEADDLTNLAELHIDTGQYDRARELACASLELARDAAEPRVVIDATNTLGVVARLLGDAASAARCHQDCLPADADGYGRGEATALIGLASAQADLGQLDVARITAERAVLITRKTGLRLLEGHALTAVAGIALACGEPDRARADAQAALEVYRMAGHGLGAARAEQILSEVAAAHNQAW